jgi:lysophospholipase L1-like esterase
VAGNASLVLISLTVIIAAVEAALWVYERSEIVVSRVEQDADYIEVPVKNENAAIVKSGDNEETHQPTVGLKDDVSILEQRLKSFGLDLPRELLRIAQSRKELITMPSDMDRVKIEVENAAYAYRWHRAIHVHDQNHMRRTSPLPPPRKGVYRIMVVGDSLTYGYGIDENWTYSSLLDESLSKDYKIEVINLGVSGLQSEDIATLVPKYLPMLRPNLVVYGVCLNDFLPSGVGEYANNYAYQIPLSDEVKKFFTNRTRIMRMSQDGYNQLLLKLGLRNGFFEDILKDFNGYQIRFDRDVKNINNSVTNAGAQPVLAMVLDQFPDLQNGYRITKVAESAFRSAGMEVIEMTPYYRHFNGNRFQVSRWEGHPNEVANAIWAKMLEKYLRKSQMLNGYRKSD